MATIRFRSSGVDVTVSIDVPNGERRTLLSVAREHGVPLLFNCQSGACGACIVHVETISNGGKPSALMNADERYLLTAMRFLSKSDIEEAERAGTSPGIRLACAYELQNEKIVVVFDSDLKAV